jgi:tetratricopeptide (TPR) repeat protein
MAEAEMLLRRSVELIREDGGLEIDGLGAIAPIWLELGSTDLYYATVERYLELAPDKGPLRFALAIKYGSVGRDADALFHYRQHIRTQQENSGAYNNAGVAADALKLPVTAIDAYLKAEETGSSLATSNRAYALLGAGFVDDATKSCEEALSRPNPDPRVSDARAKAQRAREDEQERETRLIGETAARRKLYRHMGRLSLLKTPDPFPVTWKGLECILSAKVKDDSLTIVGTYERDKPALLSTMLGLGGATKEEVRVEYAGRLYGLAFVGSVVVQPTNSAPTSASLLGGKEDKKDCVGYLDASGGKFEILEASTRFYTLTIVQAEQ